MSSIDPIETHGLYVDQRGEGEFVTYVAYVDGWIGVTRGHPNREEAAREYFTPWAAAGYNALYYREEDDALLGPACADCACADWLEHGLHWSKHNDDGDTRFLEDITCAFCGTVITQQLCSECGNPLAFVPEEDVPLPVFENRNENGLHGSCLAEFIVRKEAIKSGLQEYTFTQEASDRRWHTRGTYVVRGRMNATSQ